MLLADLDAMFLQASQEFQQSFSGTRAVDNLRAFFESVALSVLVRNGDAHLKNFGMLYLDPASADVRLAPIYDVVTTTIYPYYNQRMGLELVDRTLALKFFSGAKTRNYPSRDELIRFGKTICRVNKPDETLDRIAAGMSATLAENRHLLSGVYAAQLQDEWRHSLRQMTPTSTPIGASFTAGAATTEQGADPADDDRPAP